MLSHYKIVSTFFLLLLFVTELVAAKEKVSLQLKWKHAFQFAGFYIAKEKGYYTEKGLDVEIREVSAQTNLTDEVLSGRANFSITDSALVYTRLKNKPVVALAAIFQHSPLTIMTLKSSAIKKPEDLVGKKVMMFANDKAASLNSMLRSQQVYPEDLITIPHSFDINDLINGNADASAVYSSDQPHQLERLGIEYNLIDPKDYNFNFYGDILFTSEDEVINHPERTKAFYGASLKGWEYAFEHIDETIQLIMDKYNSQNLTAAHLHYEAITLRKLSGISEGLFGQISKLKINAIANIYQLLGLSSNQYSLDNFIYKEGQSYLTPQEINYIENNEIQIISTDNWAPFNTRSENQQLNGIAIDYWNLIRQKTGLKSKITTTNTWLDVIDGIRNKTSDITISTGITKDREKYALFSMPYASFPIALATKNGNGFLASPSDLINRKLAVGKNYSAHKILKHNYPYLNFVPVDSVDTALELVSEDKVFAAADILPVLAFKIAKLGYSNIKISGTSQNNFDVRIMIRDDLPQLLSIINKGINAITAQEKKVIFNKWIAVQYDKEPDYTLLWKIIIPLLILLFLTYLWNRALNDEIKRRKVAEEKLNILATTDLLTSISNRYQIETLLEQQFMFYKRHGREFSIMFLDLDDFKKVNDNYGHETGDSVLKEFSTLVHNNIREIDFFGRWGGEEFLVLLPETTIDQTIKLADKIRQVIFDFNFTEVKQLSCSIGIAEVKTGDTAKSLLDRADKGLYQAKEMGKNRVETFNS